VGKIEGKKKLLVDASGTVLDGDHWRLAVFQIQASLEPRLRPSSIHLVVVLADRLLSLLVRRQ
jgi:hypothetical protein